MFLSASVGLMDMLGERSLLIGFLTILVGVFHLVDSELHGPE